MQDDHSYRKGKYRRIRTTRKLSCPAKILVNERVVFPEYKVSILMILLYYLALSTNYFRYLLLELSCY